MMPNTIVARLTGAALALALGATVASAEEAKLELMFVQSSAGFTADPAAQTLRLTDVTPQALYFSDRPERVAGHISMDDYLSYWREGADNFSKDPPNATLSVYEPGSSENSVVVVELVEPIVEGKDIVYRYNLIEGQMPESGGATALFIDRIGPGGGVGFGFHGVGVGARGPGVAGWRGVAVRRDCAAIRC